jgi:hypothetical protein
MHPLEMLAIAAAQVSGERVRFVQADLFTWTPDRRYDVVFFGFWLSHVPFERFESFAEVHLGSARGSRRSPSRSQPSMTSFSAWSLSKLAEFPVAEVPYL